MSISLRRSIIEHFSGNNRFGFSLQEVAREFPGRNRVYLTRILADMVRKGFLLKITRDSYHIIPWDANPETYTPDGYEFAKYLMQEKEYYFGYGTALRIHGLSLQPEGRESGYRIYVVTKDQMRPPIRKLRGLTCQFIHHDAIRFFGSEKLWINRFGDAMVSDLERTIVDIAACPRYCNGIVELGSAIFRARDRIDQRKLFYYIARNKNLSARKRFLFLTSLLGKEWTTDHARMMEELGTGNSLLDPGAPDTGRKQRKFRLKINVDPQHLKRKILT